MAQADGPRVADEPDGRRHRGRPVWPQHRPRAPHPFEIPPGQVGAPETLLVPPTFPLPVPLSRRGAMVSPFSGPALPARAIPKPSETSEAPTRVEIGGPPLLGRGSIDDGSRPGN